MKRRRVIGSIILVIGIGIFSYPLIRQAYSAHRQEELKNAFEEILSEKAAVTQVPVLTQVPDTDLSHAAELMIDESSDDADTLNLEETKETADTQDAKNIKNRLKGQTLCGLIEIKKLDLIYAIVEGTKDENLGVAIGHMKDTKAIGETGNCVIAGHRGGTSGPYFKYINELTQGDEITLTDLNGTVYVYHVTESFVVEPDEMWVAENTTEEKMLTMITCQESGSKRLIVRAVCE